MKTEQQRVDDAKMMAEFRMDTYDDWPLERRLRVVGGPIIPTRRKNVPRHLPAWPAWTKVKVMT